MFHQDFRTCRQGRFCSGFVYFNQLIPRPSHGMVHSGNSIQTATPSQHSTRHLQVKLNQNQVITNKDLHDYFSKFGRVQKTDWQRNELNCTTVIISFRDRPSAVKALSSNLEINGQPLDVSFCEPKNASHAAQHPPESPQTVSTFFPTPPPPTTTTYQADFGGISQQYQSQDHFETTASLGSRRNTAGSATVNRQFQGVSVSQLPDKVSESALKQQLTDLLTASRSNIKLVDILFENSNDATKALLLLQNVTDMDLLIGELNQHSLPSMSGQRLRARAASQSAINDAQAAYLNNKSTKTSNTSSLSRADSTSSNSSSTNVPDPKQKDACRTLYVGNLDKYCKEDVLRARFSEFGHIVDLDIKNKESFAPFAFVQFNDIASVVKSIMASQSGKLDTSGLKVDRNKLKVNFGKAMPSTKLWIGALPRSCSHEYLFSRLRNISPEGVQEVNYDATNHEALVIFKNVDQAQQVYNKIKSRLFVIPPEKPQKDSQSSIQQVDFASDKLHDFFVDRKHGRIRTTDLNSGIESPPPAPIQQVQQRKPQNSDSTKRLSNAARSFDKPNQVESATSNVLQGAQPVRLTLSSRPESESLLIAPPPDPPSFLPAEASEEVDSMSSRHNRRSSSRRSSPDSTRHRRDRDRYERRSDSRSYKSRHYEKKYEKKKSESRHDSSRHTHRSPSSSSSTSSSSGSSRSSMSSSSSVSNASNSPKSATRKSTTTVASPTTTSSVPTPTIPPIILGHLPFNQPPPPIPQIKATNSTVPLKRSDAVDTSFPPASTSSVDLDSPERMLNRLPSIQQKISTSQAPKSAPIPTSSTKPDFKSSSSISGSNLTHRYWSGPSRTPAMNLQNDVNQLNKDPRPLNENYSANTAADLEPFIYFPSFFMDDELGKQYCQRMQTLTERRNSQSSVSSLRQKSSVDYSTNHPPVSRSNSGSDHSKTPVHLPEIPPSIPSFDMPIIPPYPPPPLSTPLESPGPVEARQRSDSSAENNSFNERLQSLSSKISSILKNQSPYSAPPQQRTSTIEEDLQRFKMKKLPGAKSCDSSQSTTPTSKLNDGLKPTVSSSSNRLTINIPASTSNSSTPVVGSPALQHQPTPSPAANTNSVRSMSFTQPGNQSMIETPPVTSLAPRSSSYNFTTSPASSSLPLPPQPPTLQMTSPKPDKILSPRIPTPKSSISLVSPTATSQAKPETTPTLNIRQTTATKSAVTSPLTTPSTPRSASSMPSTSDSKSATSMNRDEEEVKRKKQDEKMKLFQSIRVPKKARDSTADEIFSFSSPLSRAPHTQPQQTTPHAIPTKTNPLAAQNKPVEKPTIKPHVANPTINRSSTQSSLQKVEKKEKKSLDEKEKHDKLKPSKSSLSILQTKSTDSKHSKPSVLSSLSEKERRNSEALIENEMKKIREKATRKFPTDEKEREKYVKKKQEKLRQRAEEVLRQKEKQKEAAKKSDEAQRKLQQKSTEHKSSTHLKPVTKEPSKEKDIKALKEKHKEKEKQKEQQRDSAEKAKQQQQKAQGVRKRRQKTPSESDESEESEEDNSSEILAECGLKNIDLEMQRILFEEAKAGQLNLSMYERVRRRRQKDTQSDENKKNQALEMLRENKKKEKKPKRVQLSSDEDSDAADSHKRSKASASENSDSDHSEASTAASSSNAKKLSKPDLKKKDKTEKQKKEKEKDKPTISKKLSLKKPEKKEIADDSESDTRSSSSKPQKPVVKSEKKAADSSDELMCEMAVKKLKKNLLTYKSESEESESESVVVRGRPPKKKSSKLKPKKPSIALLGDDDFCADSDEDKSNDVNKEVVKIYTGKRGRPREKVKIVSDKLGKPAKTDEQKFKKLQEKLKAIKKPKQKDDEKSEEPIKKKPKVSSPAVTPSLTPTTTTPIVKTEPEVRDEENDKKRRASSEIEVENMPTIKRPKPEKTPSLEHKMSPVMDDFPFSNSPTPATSSDVRLENFVTQSCEVSTPSTNLISPLGVNGRFTTPSTEETHDAVESLNSLMNANHQRSEDEEEEPFTIGFDSERLSHSSSHSNIDQTSRLMSPKTEIPADLQQNESLTPTTQKEASPQQHVCPPDPAPTVSQAEPTFSSGKTSPISSVVQSIAHGASFSIENIANSSAPLNEQKSQPIVTTVASAIPAHLPTPPPSRSSNGSPATQIQYPARQQSPLVATKSVQPTVVQPVTEITQKRLSDGAVQPPSTQIQHIPEHVSPVVQNQQHQQSARLPDVTPSLVGSSGPIQLPPNMAQFQQQLLAQRGSLGEQEMMALNEMMAKKQQQSFMQQQTPVTVMQPQFVPQVPTQQRTRTGSQSTVEVQPAVQQRKPGLIPSVPTSQVPQQFNVARPNVNTNIQPASTSHLQTPITTNPQAVMSHSNDAYLGHLSQMLSSMNPAINNPVMMQQLLSSPQFLAQLPHLATNPQALEMFVRNFQSMQQNNQQSIEMDKLVKSVVQMVGPNAPHHVVQQAILSLYQQQAHQQQARQHHEQEIIEKQKQMMLNAYHEDLARRQAMQQQLPVTQPQIPIPTNTAPVKQHQNRFDELQTRFPICWQGTLALKNNGTFVQMHRISSNQLLADCTTSELSIKAEDGLPTIRITQRMRLQNPHLISVCNKMNDENEFVALVCFPCGQNAGDILQQTTKMTNTFIDYFTQKMAAGVVSRAPNVPHPSCIAHVFPPCDFSAQQLKRLAPEMFEEIEKIKSTYLFIVVTRNDGTNVLHDSDNAKFNMLPMQQAIGKTV